MIEDKLVVGKKFYSRPQHIVKERKNKVLSLIQTLEKRQQLEVDFIQFIDETLCERLMAYASLLKCRRNYVQLNNKENYEKGMEKSEFVALCGIDICGCNNKRTSSRASQSRY